MLAHPLLPETNAKVAFWALAVHDTASGSTVHAALIDLLTGHTLWSYRGTAPMDRTRCEDAAQIWTAHGWRVEPLPA